MSEEENSIEKPSQFLLNEWQNKSYTLHHNYPRLRVGTYNIAAGMPLNRPNPHALGKAIKALNVDLLALQEVDRLTEKSGHLDQAKIIAEEAKMHYYYHPTFATQGGTYGTAILSKQPFEEVDAYPIYSGDEEPRQIIISKTIVSGFERPIFFINIHTEYHIDDTIRFKQMQILNEILNDDEAPEIRDKFTGLLGGIVLLAGDFNALTGSRALNELRGFWNELKDPERMDYRSWPAANPTVDLDHIFASGSQHWSVRDCFLPNDDFNQKGFTWPLLSDHLPLVMDLELREY